MCAQGVCDDLAGRFTALRISVLFGGWLAGPLACGAVKAQASERVVKEGN